ncbi:MAG TPA: ATP-binding protein, partial [Micromonospora sp.]
MTGEPVRQRVVLPAEHRSVVLARRMVRSVLESAGLAGPVADAVLLTSEVCENAVLHAGTPFELDISLAGGALTVAVTDHGSAPLERRRVEPAVAGSRAATHGRGLLLVDEIAAAWGTRHSRSGRQVWFTLTADGTTPSPPDLAPVGVAEVPGAGGAAGTPDVGGAAAAGGTTGAAGGDGAWPELGRARWLLRLPSVAPGPGAT